MWGPWASWCTCAFSWVEYLLRQWLRLWIELLVSEGEQRWKSIQVYRKVLHKSHGSCAPVCLSDLLLNEIGSVMSRITLCGIMLYITSFQ